MVLSSTSGNDAGLVEDSAAAVLLQACLGWGKMESTVYEETGGKQAEDFYCYSSGTSYGLSAEVKRLLRDTRGITALYEWQDRCLCSPALHLLYSLPTSGGKTLVAEILILQQVLQRGKDLLFLFPFVSIVQEKSPQLTALPEPVGFEVEEYASSKGRLLPRKRRDKRVLYVTTNERGPVQSILVSPASNP